VADEIPDVRHDFRGFVDGCVVFDSVRSVAFVAEMVKIDTAGLKQTRRYEYVA